MKKIDKQLFDWIPSVEIYMEDINLIFELLKDSCKEVHISDEDFEYESIEECIEKRGNSPSVLSLHGYYPHLWLSFNRKNFPNCIHLFSTGGSKKAEGLYFQVRDILLRHKKFSNYAFNLKSAFIVFFIALGLSPWFKAWFPQPGLRILILIAALGYIILSILHGTGTLYSINLFKKHEKESFF